MYQNENIDTLSPRAKILTLSAPELIFSAWKLTFSGWKLTCIGYKKLTLTTGHILLSNTTDRLTLSGWYLLSGWELIVLGYYNWILFINWQYDNNFNFGSEVDRKNINFAIFIPFSDNTIIIYERKQRKPRWLSQAGRWDQRDQIPGDHHQPWRKVWGGSKHKTCWWDGVRQLQPQKRTPREGSPLWRRRRTSSGLCLRSRTRSWITSQTPLW